MRWTSVIGLFVFSTLAAHPAMASLVFIDFDSLPPVNDNNHPGNVFASDGVVFSTLLSIPDSVVVGDVLSVTELSPTFWLIPANGNISAPNFIAATNGTVFDLLMSFDGVVSDISLQTDDANEGSAQDIVRLLGLQQVGLNLFEIVALSEGFDNVVSAPDNILSLSSVSITHAIFQTTTEQEGFDNLQFNLVSSVPEPGTPFVVWLGVAAYFGLRRRLRSP